MTQQPSHVAEMLDLIAHSIRELEFGERVIVRIEALKDGAFVMSCGPSVAVYSPAEVAAA